MRIPKLSNRPLHTIPAPNDLHGLFANITSHGPSSQSFLFQQKVLSHYAFFGLVETHVVPTRTEDINARWKKLKFTPFSNPATPTVARGSHGGEMFLAHSAIPCTPIDPQILKQISSTIESPMSFAACEYRMQGLTMIFIVSYLNCGEGLSSRNWLIIQQIAMLIRLYNVPFYWWGDHNCPPQELADSGLLAYIQGTIKLPLNCTSTSKGSGIIDYAIYSPCIQPLVGDLVKVPAPFTPHYAFDQCFHVFDKNMTVNMQIMPRALPIDIFRSNWAMLSEQQQLDSWQSAQLKATNKLNMWGIKTGHKILGYPDVNLIHDCRYDLDVRQHVVHGEHLAQAALSVELCVCDVAKIDPNQVSMYIGRSQYPRFGPKQLIPNSTIIDKFVSPELNMWSDLLQLVESLCSILGDDELLNLTDLNIGINRQQPAVDFVVYSVPIINKYARTLIKLPISNSKVNYTPPLSVFRDEHPVCHLASYLFSLQNKPFYQVKHICDHIFNVKQDILSTLSAQASTDFKGFAVEQLNKGAGVLHKYSNRDNTTFMDISLFDRTTLVSSPEAAMETKRDLWATKWTRNSGDKLTTATKLFALCALALADDTTSNSMTGATLHDSAATYKNKAFGSDMWSSLELAGLPILLIDAIALVCKNSFNACCAPHQTLLNLQGCLGKPGSGHRTVTKTPMLYRLTCREGNHRDTIRKWELSIALEQDSAKKGSSAKKAALKRCFYAELYTLCGFEAGANLFDFEFFSILSISPRCLTF